MDKISTKKTIFTALIILVGLGISLTYNSNLPKNSDVPSNSEHISAEKQLVRTNQGSESYKIFPEEKKVLVGFREGQPEFGYNHTLDQWTANEMVYIARNRTKQTLTSKLGNSAKNISVYSTTTENHYEAVRVEYNLNRSYPFSYSELRDAVPKGYTTTIYFGNHSNTVQIPVAIENLSRPAYNLVNRGNQTQPS
jgi:hypothetical protein